MSPRVSNKNHFRLFEIIAMGYQWFFKSQYRGYKKLLEEFGSELEIPSEAHVLDIGCGTGAFGIAFQESGHKVYGIDVSKKMVKIAKRNHLQASQANILEGLSFPNDSFDIVIAANLVHGLGQEDRLKIYKESARISKKKVLFHDYNSTRNPAVSLIEWIEGGDYFNFIKTVPNEFSTVFRDVQVIDIGKGYSSWYLCTV
ncbi:MAG: class I SAM-dependent methyltransferase [Promethearchaeota archaeon]